ncbi:NAD-dependent epimerase/dehydratase family protein [Streptomyces sp. NBC_00091]|uniref:NAD-dependent epimerase/dehydratase family protein n=1 Tax=Streptomyces sp. NBC_00091 TaxID=2975648 RepID=UPI00225610E0|nr:NAD-dependent epimerase/dehydratase family protein [Streptomyces sp. NBC_00091]MCX5379735.1 NAD-dependent epimerase/dehydratase family protein [Streptomyces sp. NBC_00091]
MHSTADQGLTLSRAVVTGAAGFIGSHLVESLLADGISVVGVDRRTPLRDPAAAANLGHVLDDPNFTFVTADLRTSPLVPLFRRADAVFHLAALPGVRGSWGERFAEYTACNVFATERVASACEDARVPRLVYASSSSVYGNSGGATDEETAPCPESPYAVSKLAGEQLCLAHARQAASTVTAVALRLFTVYGPRQRPDMLIGRALTAALGGPRLNLYGDGSHTRDFTYVGDVVGAALAAATGPLDTTVLNVGAGVSTSVLDLLSTVEELTGHAVPVDRLPAQAGDVDATLADRSKAAAVLGWKPHTTLLQGVSHQLSHLTARSLRP